MRNWIDLFEQTASEQPPETIYHGSSLRALLRIIHLNALTPGADDADQAGTFCSADPEVAARYTTDQMYRCPAGGVIVFNTASLIRDGNTVSSYFYHTGNDGEEWVIRSPHGDDVRNISQHIREIRLLPGALDEFRRNPECCHTEDEWDTDEEYHAAVKAFVARFG